MWVTRLTTSFTFFNAKTSRNQCTDRLASEPVPTDFSSPKATFGKENEALLPGPFNAVPNLITPMKDHQKGHQWVAPDGFIACVAIYPVPSCRHRGRADGVNQAEKTETWVMPIKTGAKAHQVARAPVFA